MGDPTVTIGTVASALTGVRSVRFPDTPITSITHDSRKATNGALFVAIKGMTSDGHDYVDTALSLGAGGVLVDHGVDPNVPQIVVDDTRQAMPWAARSVYREPDSALEIVGITGTNGKTTVAHMCESIWEAAGLRPGLIGTLGGRIAGEAIRIERTTPEATDLQALLGSMRDASVDVVAMEVSSHALALHRADAIRFAIGAFTNLSQDHLDFHGDMETYFAAKASLFVPDRVQNCVINTDDHYGERLFRDISIPGLSVGSTPTADVGIATTVATSSGTEFHLVHETEEIGITIPLIGRFNVLNAAVAAAIAITEGVGSDAIVEGLASIQTIPGRMEIIQHSGSFTVVVDYAHTPDAIAEVLQASKAATTGKVLAVVGAAGDRDRNKRGLMGASSVRFADVTFITSDNPRTEDPAVIAREVQRGADAVPGSISHTILDRRDAINAAVNAADSQDIVLILGKGHEQGIEIDGVVTPFDDRSEARRALEHRGLELT